MADSIRFIIVGLGNVGRQYESSRHNIGFEVVDRIAASYNLQFTPGKGDFYLAPASARSGANSGFFGMIKKLFGNHEPANSGAEKDETPFLGVLLKPTTLMNRSGRAVRQALELFDVAPQQVIVVVDDFHLPLGRLRLRKSGSDGGHNGLKSIITELGTDNFPRLRVGIGPKPTSSEVIDFVLGQFTGSEALSKDSAIRRAAEACEELLCSSSENPLDIVAAKYNTVLSDPAPGSDID